MVEEYEKHLLDRVMEMEGKEVSDLMDDRQSVDYRVDDLGLDEFVPDFQGKGNHGLP